MEQERVDHSVNGNDDNTTGKPSPTSRPPESRSPEPDSKERLAKAARRWTIGMGHAFLFCSRCAGTIARWTEFDPLKVVDLLSRFLAQERRAFIPRRFETLSNSFVKIGHKALVVTAALNLVFWIVFAIKNSSAVHLLYGLGYSALIFVLQYAATQFLSAGDTLIRSSPSRLASRAFLDSVALLLEIAGLIFFVWYADLARKGGDGHPFWFGFGLWALCSGIAWMALNPAMVTLTLSEQATAGEEAIGILSFLAKAVLRIVPLAFGAGVLVASLALLVGIVSLFRAGADATLGQWALKQTCLYACLPFLSYVGFAFYHLTLDILRAILSLPSKLDRLAEIGSKPGQKSA